MNINMPICLYAYMGSFIITYCIVHYFSISRFMRRMEEIIAFEDPDSDRMSN
jgi:hypothetical protein